MDFAVNDDNPIIGGPAVITRDPGRALTRPIRLIAPVPDVADVARAGLRGARSGLTRGGVG